VTIASEWDKIQTQHGWLTIDPKRGSDRGKAMLSNENVPGPGAYSAKEDYVAKRGPAYSIQQRGGQTRSELGPGPGMYDPKLLSGNAISIGTSNRSNLGGVFRGREPGPGQYSDIDGSKVSIGYSIGKATRIESAKGRKLEYSSTPGPGAYRVPAYVA
jgi:Sperm-tail PG-rich repeat